MQTTINLDTFTVETCDTVQSKSSGYEGVVVSFQEMNYGKVFEIVRTDTGATVILLEKEITLVKKSRKSFTGFQVSDETAARARNWQEAVNGASA